MSRVWPVVLTPANGAFFVLVSTKARERIERFLRSDPGLFEAGGILLGLRRDPHIEVTDATLPSANDIRRHYGFVRRCAKHQASATAAWRRSDHLVDYVGEWHTHPETRPTPSRTDRIELLRRGTEHKSEALLELIVGTEAVWAGIAAHEKYEPLRTIKRTG